MSTKLAHFAKQFVSLAQKAVVGNAKTAVQHGNGGYADWVIVALQGLREYLGHSFRQLLGVLHEMPRMMTLWRGFLRLSADLHEPGEVQAIDATGFDRRAASRRYARRTNYTFRGVKTTVLVDCKTSTILDIHCSMKRLHDTQIGEQVLKRNLDRVETVTADKGYDWELLHRKLRSEDVKSVIKYREFGWHGVANNVLINDTTYHQRSNIEATFFALRRKYGEIVRARTWFGQFRELVLKCAIRNVELVLSAQTHEFRRLNKAE